MTYIINPWVFYWISLADAIKTVSIVSMAVTGIACFVSIVAFTDAYGEKEEKICKRLIKIFAVLFTVCLTLTIIVPSQKTCLQILIAKQATYENATWTIDSIKSAVDYIVNAIKELK